MTDPHLPSDRDIIERVRSGDAAVIGRLQDAYWGPLVQFADRLLDGMGDPQDVVQEAFIRLWARREHWGSDGSVRALLYAVTRNAALDERRRRTRRERADAVADPPPHRAPPSTEAAAEELRRAAVRAVAQLPPKRREVFRLAREEGLTYAEIASVLGVSPQTVANHMSLALADLRHALADFLVDEATHP
jgi:RNA polymerase sigma-70 factor (family 1)